MYVVLHTWELSYSYKSYLQVYKISRQSCFSYSMNVLPNALI